MTVAGVSLKPVPADSRIFTKYEGKLGLDLVILYELEFNETTTRKLSGPEWSGVRYFHGTGHCGCVDRYANRALEHKITSSSWCSTRTCAVRGILRHGYLMRFCLREGHFVSSSGQTALGYAQSRHVGKVAIHYRAIFVCKIRNCRLNVTGRRYVRRDKVCAYIVDGGAKMLFG
ncbi:hypothetical protein CPB97_000752 [Podila verticillata]|nr:hypothetical protein CPB97_000752 [Podila verticillata]